jgi:hypothetical protein
MLAAAVEDLASPEAEAAAAQAEEAEGVRKTGCCRTGLPTEENTAAVVACQHLHSVVGCMWLVEVEAAVYDDPVDIHQP